MVTKEQLAERYKELLNRDIDDFSIGLKNVKVRNEMQEIESKLKVMNLVGIDSIPNNIGKYSKNKYWIHKQPNWGQLTTKSHPFDITNTRNRKFPKIKRY